MNPLRILFEPYSTMCPRLVLGYVVVIVAWYLDRVREEEANA